MSGGIELPLSGPDEPDHWSTSAALARVTAERDELAAQLKRAEENVQQGLRRAAQLGQARAELAALASLAEGFRRTIAELTDERDHARSERDALKALYADAVNRLNTQP